MRKKKITKIKLHLCSFAINLALDFDSTSESKSDFVIRFVELDSSKVVI